MKNDKKKIAIVTHEFACRGGIEISLINLLKYIDFEKYDIDLFTYNEQNHRHYIGEIPSEVRVIYTEQKNGAEALMMDLKRFRFVRFIKSVFARVMLRFTVEHAPIYLKYLYLCYPLSEEKYLHIYI